MYDFWLCWKDGLISLSVYHFGLDWHFKMYWMDFFGTLHTHPSLVNAWLFFSLHYEVHICGFWATFGTYYHVSIRMNCNDSMILWLFILCPYFVLGMSTTIKCPVRIARNACCLAYYNVTDILVFLTYYVIGLTKSFPDTLNMFVLALKHSLFVINNGVRLLNWWKESSITKLWGPDWGGHRFCFWTSKCHFLKCIYLHRGRNLRNSPEWMPLEPEHFIRFQSVVKDL